MPLKKGDRPKVEMRWEDQSVENVESRQLPGYAEAAAVRTFGAPEVRNTRFYEVHAKSALNRVAGSQTPFHWTVNPYRGCTHSCSYCYARPTHEYLGFDAGDGFDQEIVVKVNVAERLRAELSKRSWKGEWVALGTNTDPYQWAEGHYELMRGIWEALRDHRNEASVVTKSPLLLRDLDLMLELSERAPFTAYLSIPTMDQEAWRLTEPRSPNPKARLDALRKLTEAGISTGLMIAPVLPGINDDATQIGKLVETAMEIGVDSVDAAPLHLRGSTKQVFLERLGETHPDLVARYEGLYGTGSEMAGDEHRRLTALVGPRGRTWETRREEAREREEAESEKAAEPPMSAQSSLF
jgi:DNA repair photolyase